MHTHMGIYGMQCPHAVAYLTIADKLRVIGIPTWVLRILRAALGAVCGHITLKSHVVGIKVSVDRLGVLIEAYKGSPSIDVVIGRWMSGIIAITGAGDQALFPVAVLTRKRTRSNIRYGIHLVVPEVTDLFNQVWIVAAGAVLSGSHIRVVMPAVKYVGRIKSSFLILGSYITPTVATTGRAVPDDQYPVLTIRSTWGTCGVADRTQLVP